jgi:phosphoheptose isomerase
MTQVREPSTGRAHVAALATALPALDAQIELLERWGAVLADRLSRGARLLAAGNGGSAAQAQHLTAEIVGRYCTERRPLSAVALHTEPSALTAICNDYGIEEAFARQVAAHGRTGDICILLSTSGSSRNVVAAARRARELGVLCWAITGPAPNPLAAICDEALCLDTPETSTIQELHLVVIHLLCAAMDSSLGVIGRES